MTAWLVSLNTFMPVLVMSVITLLLLEGLVVLVFARGTRRAAEREAWEGVLSFAAWFGHLPLPFTQLTRLAFKGPHLSMSLFAVHALRQLGQDAAALAMLRTAATEGAAAERLTARLHLCSALVRQSELDAAGEELGRAQAELEQVRPARLRIPLGEQLDILRHDIAARRGCWPESYDGLPVGSRLMFHLARGEFLEGLAWVKALRDDAGAGALTGGPLLTATVLAAEADRVKEVGEDLEALGGFEGLGHDARHVAAAVGAWHSARLGQGDVARQAAALVASYPRAGDHGATTASCWLARTFLLLAEPQEALSHAEHAVSRAAAPLSRHVAHFWRGRCHEELEQHAEARADYEALLALNLEAAWTRSATDRLT